MELNFDTRKTSISRALKTSSSPLLKYSSFFAQLFFYLFLISFFLIGFSFLGFLPLELATKIPIFLLFCFLFFLELHLFLEFSVKIPKLTIPLSQAAPSEQYNLAEFLTLEGCSIVEIAIKHCKKRRLLEVPSEALLYAGLLENNDIRVLLVRLGVDVKKTEADVKNYLEKQEKAKKFNLVLSESFVSVMKEAANIAQERGRERIGEKELLVGLAKQDEFFKKMMIEHDLKEKDIEDLSFWLDGMEKKQDAAKKFWTKENLSRMGSLGKDWASGYTITLDQYSLDLREIVSKNMMRKMVGHEKEIESVETILSKTSQSNALIVGEIGVGRKSIVQALAQRCYLGQSTSELNGKRVVELDMVAIISQIQDQEKLEVTLDQIFQESLASGNVILVVDSLDEFISQKTQKPGDVDISVILSKYLAMPNFQFIGITSYDGLHRKLEQNSSFLQYFRKVEVTEVSETETIQILQSLALGLEQKYRMLILYPSIREIVNLTGRYMPTVPFPKKAIDALYEAVSYAKSQKARILEPNYVAKIISDKTEIPIGKIESKEKTLLLNLEQLIHQRIVNQKEAVGEIAIAMRRARAGIASKKRPMGTFLFLGPTGVGKTETAKALSEIYFGQISKGASEHHMIRIDMSEFQAVSDIPRLIGALSPVEMQGILTTPVRENPFSLVLLDEIEKAHPNILNLFLQVFDEGHITDGQGRKVLFTNTIIIATSNAGAPMIFSALESGSELKKQDLLDNLFKEGIFKPEFVNRFDAAVIFQPLTKEHLMEIAQMMLNSLASALKEKDIELLVTDALKEKIVELSYKPEFGAREMRRVVQDTIENKVADSLLSDTIAKGDKIEINPENFEIVVLK